MNLRSGRARQGGSTITQQVIKNELLTPERSFERKIRELILASSRRRLFHQILTYQPPPPRTANRSISAELDQVTMRALAKEPSERYQSATELLDDLRACPGRELSRPEAPSAASALPSVASFDSTPGADS